MVPAGQISSPLTAMAHLCGRSILALLDTGSCVSFIQSALAEELQLSQEVPEQPFQIRVASGATLLVQTRARVLLQMGDQKFMSTLLVADIGQRWYWG